MTTVTFHINGVQNRAEAVRSKLAFSAISKGEVIIKSPLDEAQELNDHLVWFWGILKHERRYLKTLQEEGAKLSCVAKVPRGNVKVLPNGAELLHLLGAELVIGVK